MIILHYYDIMTKRHVSAPSLWSNLTTWGDDSWKTMLGLARAAHSGWKFSHSKSAAAAQHWREVQGLYCAGEVSPTEIYPGSVLILASGGLAKPWCTCYRVYFPISTSGGRYWSIKLPIMQWNGFGVVFYFALILIGLGYFSFDQSNSAVAVRKLWNVSITSEMSALNFNSVVSAGRLFAIRSNQVYSR